MKQQYPETDNPVFSEALDWLALRENQQLTTEQQASFLRWLNRSPEHASAFAEAETLWQLPDITLAAQQLQQQREQQPRPEKRRWLQKLNWPKLSAVAAAAAVITLSVSLFTTPPQPGDYITDTGERKQWQLNDGSVLTLNTGSRVSVTVSAEKREVILHDGEAFFEVAKNDALPFQIKSGKALVTVVGTAFTVRQHNQLTRVSVQQGLVRVAEQATDTELPLLQAGDSAIMDKQLQFQPQGARLQDFSWVHNRLIFEDQLLSDIVTEIARYHSGFIWLGSSSLGQKRITGNFSLDDPEATLQSLARVNNARLITLPGMVLMLDNSAE